MLTVYCYYPPDQPHSVHYYLHCYRLLKNHRCLMLLQVMHLSLPVTAFHPSLFTLLSDNLCYPNCIFIIRISRQCLKFTDITNKHLKLFINLTIDFYYISDLKVCKI